MKLNETKALASLVDYSQVDDSLLRLATRWASASMSGSMQNLICAEEIASDAVFSLHCYLERQRETSCRDVPSHEVVRILRAMVRRHTVNAYRRSFAGKRTPLKEDRRGHTPEVKQDPADIAVFKDSTHYALSQVLQTYSVPQSQVNRVVIAVLKIIGHLENAEIHERMTEQFGGKTIALRTIQKQVQRDCATFMCAFHA